jgi:NADPH-dependent 2,4-dienoyl-CoA reductase/sulfur reductase-like enzyme
MYAPDGVFMPMAEALKEVVSIPIILPGKMGDPYLAEKALEEGKADFIGWGRPLIADPDLPRKVAEGRLEEIRRCIHCNECLRVQWAHRAPLRCTVNPVAGREGRYGVIRQADRRKRVIVIGAGPAGMEAARVGGLRGHDVVLHERSNELGGGQLKLASVPPHKDVLRRLVDYYTACFKKLSNVEVILGKEVTAEEVVKGGADAVVLATGAEGILPDTSGGKSNNLMTAHQLLSGQRTTGERVIVVGGGSVGCEVANFLAQQGKMVTVVEMLDLVATDIHSMVRVGLLEELDKYGVKILTGVRFEALTEEGVEAVDRESRKVRLKADTVVFAVGVRANDQLTKDLKGKVKELCIIGDAKQPRRIREAISEGYITGYDL